MSSKEDLKDLILESILAERKSIKYHMVRKPNLVYKEKSVHIDSSKHVSLLKNTIQHLEALRSAYAPSSAMRHIISQACSRLKRLLNKLESV
jgi:hypothetical protein